MAKDIEISTNTSTIYDILTSFARGSLLLFVEIDKETFGTAICAIIIIIGASFYVYYRSKGLSNNCKKFVDSTDEFRNDKKTDKYNANFVLRSDSLLNYHMMLKELHDACDNCSNIFNAMKCVQLASNHPEFINARLHSDGVTPFHKVCFRGNHTLIEFMLAKGADPELKTIAGENALCMTLYHYVYTEAKDFSCLDLFSKRGYYLDRDDEWYAIILKLSVSNGNKELTNWLFNNSKSKNINYSRTRASSVPFSS
ncbi:hypothetical protein QAD02_015346 [Eretmocerus hayati]|uniref:Uncharacterized protein n=1 Tax=Eretmocerus hayati TaxID=131215 RepID=A0ACC2P8F2_9HYME|nr:hypothetical protein QAD02_015346 [Eretmocerus hayati]